MPFGSKNEETADLADLFCFRTRDGTVLAQLFRIQRPCLANRLVLGLGIAGRFRDHGVVIARFLQVILRQKLGIAAEHDIGAAACHVGRDGDGTELARLRNDLSFLLMVLGIQDGMGNAASFQQG